VKSEKIYELATDLSGVGQYQKSKIPHKRINSQFLGANLPFYSRAHGDLSIFERKASLILQRILFR